ncbi:MAG: amidohydrolase family protein, partial [Promethearchaeota archaeon]
SFPFNLVFFVGYSNIRLAGGARHENRQPRPDEMERMKQHVGEAMKAGAFGMSTGLIYSPQAYAETEELIELAKVVGEWNGLYFSHIRGEGETVLDAIRELIRIVEESGCRGGHIAHHKIADRVHWGLSTETLEMIREANERGLSITFDQYPYSRSMSSLMTALPPWALEGGTEKILTRLRDPKLREEIKRDILEDNKRDTPGWENWVKIDGFENMYVIGIHHEKWRSIRGLSIPEITQRMGIEDKWETLFNILIDEECGVSVTAESMGEEDIRRIMKSEHQMFGTDGGAVPIDPNYRMVHPRYYGTYPRILGKYVREEGVLMLEKAIEKMTSLPAWRLGLENRGHIAPGYWADIVVFDPDTIIDKATYEEPHQAPEGILHVIVNGELVVKDGVQLDVYPGQILRPEATRKHRA